MCIICDKPAGVNMPSETAIRHMFTRNPNGAGFAIQGWFNQKRIDKRTGQEYTARRFEVRYQKGFMTVDDLLEALGPLDKLKDVRVVIHCRITTAGKSDQQTTHPFPLSSIYGDLRKTEGSGTVLFHNGVIQGLGGIIDPNSSDTQDYTVGVANRLLSVPNHISKISRTIAQKIAGDCRILILYPDPKHPDFRLGTWHEDEGCQYSNTGYYKGYENIYAYTNPYGLDDDDDAELEKLLDKKDYYTNFDQWGCNVADGAWPKKGVNWIRFKTKLRMDTVIKSAKRIEQKDGLTMYYFFYDPNKAWVFDFEELEAYTEKGYQLKQDKIAQKELEEEDRMLAGIETFDSIIELEEWFYEGELINKNETVRRGVHWYIDWNELVAYTEEGLKYYYDNYWEQARDNLIEFGYDIYAGEDSTARSAVQIPTNALEK